MIEPARARHPVASGSRSATGRWSGMLAGSRVDGLRTRANAIPKRTGQPPIGQVSESGNAARALCTVCLDALRCQGGHPMRAIRHTPALITSTFGAWRGAPLGAPSINDPAICLATTARHAAVHAPLEGCLGASIVINLDSAQLRNRRERRRSFMGVASEWPPVIGHPKGGRPCRGYVHARSVTSRAVHNRSLTGPGRCRVGSAANALHRTSHQQSSLWWCRDSCVRTDWNLEQEWNDWIASRAAGSPVDRPGQSGRRGGDLGQPL